METLSRNPAEPTSLHINADTRARLAERGVDHLILIALFVH